MYIYYVPHDNYLMHHGVKGQKWGVRRYQNEDGSLTPSGKERYSKWKGPDTFKYRGMNRLADKGDKLRAKGVQNPSLKQIIARSAAISVTANLPIAVMRSMGIKKVDISSANGVRLASISPGTIATGLTALELLLYFRSANRRNAISASYARERGGEKNYYWAGRANYIKRDKRRTKKR